MTVVQIEEIARRVAAEEMEGLRREMREQAGYGPGQDEQVWAVLRELVQSHARAEQRLAGVEAALEALARAQARTEEEIRQYREASEARFARIEAALDRLAEAQARTEKRVDELAQAQTRTEERVTRLEEAFTRLIEAQARTEERLARLEMAVERLAAAQEQMARQLGALSNLLGADLEADAEEVLAYVMRQKGYRPVGPPYPVEVDGEIDVAMLLESPEGTHIWALIEVKARLRKGDVERWSKRLHDLDFLYRLAGVRIEPPYLPYAFALRVYPDAEDLAREMGIGVLDPRGERAEARPL